MELMDCASDVNTGALHTLQLVHAHFCAAHFGVVYIAVANVAAFRGLASVEARFESFIFRICKLAGESLFEK